MRLPVASLLIIAACVATRAHAIVFSEARNSPILISNPEGLVTADFDGDGDSDLAVTAPRQKRVKILSNEGNGGFTLAREVTLTHEPREVVAADFDGDGAVDLAAAQVSAQRESAGDSVAILSNDGTGGFTLSGEIAVDDGNPRRLQVADFNGDNRNDLALIAGPRPRRLEIEEKRVLVFENGGESGFTLANRLTPALPFGGLAAGDVDGQRGPDLLIIEQSERMTPDGGEVMPWWVVLLRNDGTGGFESERTASFTQPRNFINAPPAIAVAELDGSVGLDVVVVAQAVGSSVGFPGRVGIDPGIALGQFDGRNGRDIAFTNQLLVFANRGEGNLELVLEKRGGTAEHGGDTVFAGTSRGIALNRGDGAFEVVQQPRLPGEQPVSANFDADDTDDDLAWLDVGVSVVLSATDAPDDDAFSSGSIPLIMSGSLACGTWFNPQRSGEGFMLQISRRLDDREQLAQRVFLATWFTYMDGDQLWLQGAKEFPAGSKSVTVPMSVTEGADFGQNFDPDDVELSTWGTLTFHFPDKETASVRYERSDGTMGVLEQQRLVTGCHSD